MGRLVGGHWRLNRFRVRPLYVRLWVGAWKSVDRGSVRICPRPHIHGLWTIRRYSAALVLQLLRIRVWDLRPPRLGHSGISRRISGRSLGNYRGNLLDSREASNDHSRDVSARRDIPQHVALVCETFSASKTDL